MNNTYPYCATCGKLLREAIKNGHMPPITPVYGIFNITITTSDSTSINPTQGFIGMPDVCQGHNETVVPQEFYDAFLASEDW